MTTQLDIIKTPSQVLTNLINEANSNYGRAKKLVVEAYHQALKEDYTPQQAKNLLLERCKIFGRSTIYGCLPAECKGTQGQRNNITSDKSPDLDKISPKEETEFDSKGMGVVITESESSSESSTGSNGQEIEQEEEYLPRQPEIEMVSVSKVEYEELKEAVRESTQPIPASQYKATAVQQQTTFVYHQQIPKLLKAIQQTGAELGLVFHWTSDGYLQECEPGNVTKTKQEDGETSD